MTVANIACSSVFRDRKQCSSRSIARSSTTNRHASRELNIVIGKYQEQRDLTGTVVYVHFLFSNLCYQLLL
jgi:hypothetical protein